MVVSWRESALIVGIMCTLVGCGAAEEGGDVPPTIGGGSELVLAFSPMYSAYDGTHTFKIPNIVQNVMAEEWSIEPADAADLAPDQGNGGVMITTRRAGEFTLHARAGSLKGQAQLIVTAATPDQWVAGEMRYMNNVKIALPMGPPPDGGMGMGGPPELPDDAACGNCHGMGGERLNIEHTPQQIGGYSDDELIKIFMTGTKPAGSPFRSVIPPFIYQMLHTWSTATEEETRALVVYLRGLEPKSQEEINFRRPGSGTQ
jgi:cytochrome c553